MASNDGILLGQLLPSVSVRERIQTMEERQDNSSVGTNNISPRSGATLSKVEDTKSNDSDTCMSASTSLKNQYTSMTRKAHKLKTDRYFRRLQNSKKKLPNAEAVTKTRPAQVLAEERDPKQEELVADMTLKDEPRREIDSTDIPPATSFDESVLDDVIDSLFQANDAAEKEVGRLTAEGTDEFTTEKVEISRSEESVDCFLLGEKLTMPDEDDGEDEDVLEGRDAVETFDGRRCPNPIAVTLTKSEATGNTPSLSPSTPVIQNRIPYVAGPPVLPRRNSREISKSKPTTPDANDTTRMLPLPPSTARSLSIPTLDSPTGASMQNATTTSVQWSAERRFLASILFGEEGTAQPSVDDILNRPSLDDSVDGLSGCESILSTPSRLHGQPAKESAVLGGSNWKDGHTCVLRY